MTNEELSKISQLLDERDKRLDQKLDEKLKGVREDVKDQIRWAEQRIGDRIEDKLDETFRKYRDEVLTFKDEVVGEVKAMREEQTIHQGQHDNLTDLPERVEKLEEIHPNGQHPKLSP